MMRDGLSRKVFVLDLRVVVTCLLLGVSLPRWNAKETRPQTAVRRCSSPSAHTEHDTAAEE